MRKVHIGEEVWEYTLGRRNAVIHSPQGKKSVVDFLVLTGRTPNVFERGQWKRTSDGMVKPSDVKGYIEGNRDALV